MIPPSNQAEWLVRPLGGGMRFAFTTGNFYYRLGSKKL